MPIHQVVHLGYVRRPDKTLSSRKIQPINTNIHKSESHEMINKIPEFNHSVDPTNNDAVRPNSASHLLSNQRRMPNKSLAVSPLSLDNVKPENEKQLVNATPIKTNEKKFPLTLGNIIAGIATVLAVIAIGMSMYVIISNSMTTVATSVTTTMTTLWNSTGVTVAGTGTIGVGANQFNYPFGIAFDSFNALYVSDLNNSRVQKWSNAWTGTTVAGQSNGSSGSGASQMYQAAGFAIDSGGNIYIADIYNSRIQYWANGASTGTTIMGNGTCGNLTNQLCYPYNVIRDPGSGTLYIADTVNQRVVRYLAGSSTGTVVAGGTGAGSNTNQLNYPIGLYYDNVTNSLVIANAGSNNIVRWIIGASNWMLVAGSASANNGTSSTQLYYPVGVVFDLYGNMYVADTYNHRIQFFAAGSQTGVTIAGVAGTSGSSSTLLKYPYSVLLDSNLNLYVADGGNQRIQKFSRY